MSSLREMHQMQLFGFLAVVSGCLTAYLLRKIPLRGWVGILLLIVTALAWALIDTGDKPEPPEWWTVLFFVFLAPIAVSYSFRTRKKAPDRIWAKAAFVGSFLVGAIFLFMLAGIVYTMIAIH